MRAASSLVFVPKCVDVVARVWSSPGPGHDAPILPHVIKEEMDLPIIILFILRSDSLPLSPVQEAILFRKLVSCDQDLPKVLVWMVHNLHGAVT